MKYKAGNMVKILDCSRGKPIEVREMIGGIFEVKSKEDGDYRVFDKDKSNDWCFAEKDLELAYTKPKNLIPLIAKELGVEIGEEFEIAEIGVKNTYKYKITNGGLFWFNTSKNLWKDAEDCELVELILGRRTIKKLPRKPKLTEAERVILDNLPKEYKWIAREEDCTLNIYDEKPDGKNAFHWNYVSDREGLYAFEHLFEFIKWSDTEPYNIAELLGVEECVK